MLDELGIAFSVPPQCILRESPSCPGGQWLPGAFMNSAKQCLTVNRKRSLDDIVAIWRDEGDDESPVKKMTLSELRSDVWYGVQLQSLCLSVLAFGYVTVSAITLLLYLKSLWNDQNSF